jgi:hypothetical protein
VATGALTRGLVSACLVVGLSVPGGGDAPPTTWEQHVLAGDQAYQEGRLADAETSWQAAVKEARGLGPDEARLFAALDRLTSLYRAQARYDDAQPLLREALAIREKLLGAADPDVALSLEHLAAVLRLQGKYQEATGLLKRALAIRTALGTSESQLIDTLRRLAPLLDSIPCRAWRDSADRGQHVEPRRGHAGNLSIHAAASSDPRSCAAKDSRGGARADVRVGRAEEAPRRHGATVEESVRGTMTLGGGRMPARLNGALGLGFHGPLTVR